MGTAGGSGADPGRGTHSRSELTTPHLSHLAQALNVQQLLEKKFGIFWQILAPRTGPASAGQGALGPRHAICSRQARAGPSCWINLAAP